MITERKGLSFVVGGTRGKSASWHTKNGTLCIDHINNFAIPSTGTKNDFFRLLTQYIPDNADVEYIGLDFGYPMEAVVRDGRIDGRLVKFSKENYIAGLENKLIGKEFEKYLKKHKKITAKVSCANDMICSLLAGRHFGARLSKNLPVISAVVGTGVNVAFFDKARKWNKNNNTVVGCHEVAINVESAEFNKYPLSPAGVAIDMASSKPGEALIEKEVSGAYLYRIYNWIMRQAYGHKGEFVTDTFTLSQVAQQRGSLGYVLASDILDRSAQLTAVQIAGTLMYVGKTQGDITVVMSGSLFWQGVRYKERVEKWMRKVLPKAKILFTEITEHDVNGAAILTGLDYA